MYIYTNLVLIRLSRNILEIPNLILICHSIEESTNGPPWPSATVKA